MVHPVFRCRWFPCSPSRDTFLFLGERSEHNVLPRTAARRLAQRVVRARLREQSPWLLPGAPEPESFRSFSPHQVQRQSTSRQFRAVARNASLEPAFPRIKRSLYRVRQKASVVRLSATLTIDRVPLRRPRRTQPRAIDRLPDQAREGRSGTRRL